MKIFLATIPTNGNVAFALDPTALKAAEAAIAEERQRQAQEAPKPTPEPPTRKLIAVVGPRASGWIP